MPANITVVAFEARGVSAPSKLVAICLSDRCDHLETGVASVQDVVSWSCLETEGALFAALSELFAARILSEFHVCNDEIRFHFRPVDGCQVGKPFKVRFRPKISKRKRQRVFDRDGERCVYCGDTSGPFHLDHVQPLSRGGANSLDNLAVSCARCNMSKGSMTLEEWRA